MAHGLRQPEQARRRSGPGPLRAHIPTEQVLEEGGYESGWDREFGRAVALQPNRFELTGDPAPYKLYIDGNSHDPRISSGSPRITEDRRLAAPVLGRQIVFQRVENPHSGCFFLDAAQFAHWVAQPDFAVPSAAFSGPLESAATLGIMRHFRVYKPARENAGFLEIEHLDRRYLGKIFNPVAGNPPTLSWE